jgi:uncharacterized protein YkwD
MFLPFLLLLAGVSAGKTWKYAKIYALHNHFRSLHNTHPMIWNRTLQYSSQTWADKCVFQHQSVGRAFGENLYALFGPQTRSYVLYDAAQLWYSEHKLYNYSNPVFSTSTGHFTQMVWKSSTSFGCGVSFCQSPLKMWFVVCRYFPAGNVIGDFSKNVLPSKLN